ncbi:hypothetical protein I2I05_03760 [Hymenobacter sp. BT683]|uniref:Glycosyl transferase n=1 Tax=Hymenobacter jeongseonensis TaxID=2791027 RepID=A0ABS0IDR7_9BACT|nr:hypothetical protein [Hymenobacter jeongseonensis]MBF9236504.1 hypothetical protein [Hymenobacter jeongseonensis]
MTQHVILAYGQETELWRATFAVLSFYAWYEGNRADVHTVVFTDKPEFFAPHFDGLPVDYGLLTPTGLAEMRGPHQYIHRVKPAVIQRVFGEYPGDNLLFCDSDTFFIAPADALLRSVRADVSVMHLREFNFEEAVHVYAGFTPANQDRYPRRFIELIEKRTFPVGGVERKFEKTHFIWNSGVLGLSHEVGRLMPEIGALNDAFYAGSGWITSEQIAFSLALPFTTSLIASSQYVLHYWGQQQKTLMDGLLSRLTNPNFQALPHSEKLAEVKRLTRVWRRTVQLSQVREGALYAFSKGELKAGVKCAAKAFFASPFDADFAKKLLTVFRQKLTSSV